MILNVINGKKYVGGAVDVVNRKQVHWYFLRRDKHPNAYLQAAWNKHGEASFKFIVLERTVRSMLTILEQKYLDQMKPYQREIGYNLSARADRFRLGVRHTDEAKRKMSIAHKGKTHRKGWHLTDEQKQWHDEHMMPITEAQAPKAKKVKIWEHLPVRPETFKLFRALKGEGYKSDDAFVIDLLKDRQAKEDSMS